MAMILNKKSEQKSIKDDPDWLEVLSEIRKRVEGWKILAETRQKELEQDKR